MAPAQQLRLREEAVSAAQSLFERENFSLENLAHELACGLGEVNKTIVSLDMLVVEVNSRTLDRLLASISGDAVQAGSPQEALSRLCREFLAFCQKHRPLVELLFKHSYEEDFSRPDWYLDQVAACFKPLENALRALAPGRADEDCAMAARAVWSQVLGVFYLLDNRRLSPVGIQSQENLVRFSIETFLKGWR